LILLKFALRFIEPLVTASHLSYDRSLAWEVFALINPGNNRPRSNHLTCITPVAENLFLLTSIEPQVAANYFLCGRSLARAVFALKNHQNHRPRSNRLTCITPVAANLFLLRFKESQVAANYLTCDRSLARAVFAIPQRIVKIIIAAVTRESYTRHTRRTYRFAPARSALFPPIALQAHPSYIHVYALVHNRKPSRKRDKRSIRK